MLSVTALKGSPRHWFSLYLKEGDQSAKLNYESEPMVAVDYLSKALLNVECTCGEKHYPSRYVARLVNSDVFVLYEYNINKKYTDAEPIMHTFLLSKY